MSPTRLASALQNMASSSIRPYTVPSVPLRRLAMFCNALASLVGLIAYLEQKARFVREKKKPVLVGLCVLAWCASLLGFGEIIAVVYPIFGYLSIVFIVCMVVHFVQCRKKEKASA